MVRDVNGSLKGVKPTGETLRMISSREAGRRVILFDALALEVLDTQKQLSAIIPLGGGFPVPGDSLIIVDLSAVTLVKQSRQIVL